MITSMPKTGSHASKALTTRLVITRFSRLSRIDRLLPAQNRAIQSPPPPFFRSYRSLFRLRRVRHRLALVTLLLWGAGVMILDVEDSRIGRFVSACSKAGRGRALSIVS